VTTLKSIKISQEVYDRLEDFRLKRETFDQAVSRLLDLYTRKKKAERREK